MSGGDRIHVRLSLTELARLQAAARRSGVPVSKVIRAALAAGAGTELPPVGMKELTIRLPATQAKALRSEAAGAGRTVSAVVRARLDAYLTPGQPAAARRGARRSAPQHVQPPAVDATTHTRAGDRALEAAVGRIALQVCEQTVRRSEVEAAGGGLEWCPRCETSRYSERP